MAKQITSTVVKLTDTFDRVTINSKFPNGESLRINYGRSGVSVSAKATAVDNSILQKVLKVASTRVDSETIGQRAARIKAVIEKANSVTEAAYYLNRKPQTLRGWACNKDGPIQPIHIGVHLAWRLADIRTLLGV